MELGSNCWDCPVSLVFVGGLYLFLLLLAVSGAWLQKSRRTEFRSIGWALIAVAFALALLSTRAISRWGIRRGESPLDAFSLGVAYGVPAVLDLALVAITLFLARFSAKKSPS
jgi:hypothetical protein